MTFNPFEKRDAGGKWTHGDAKLAKLMNKQGGFTHLMSGETNPASGFSVGVPAPGGKDWETLPHGSTTPADIAAFREKHADELAKPNRAIGGWSNGDPADGEVRDALDVVEVYSDANAAIDAARAGNQDAIFNLETFETIATKDAKKTPQTFQHEGDRLKKEHERNFAVLTPSVSSDVELSTSDGKLAFWKQILPLKSIHYTAKDGSRQTLDFTADYLLDLAKNKAVDSVPFLLADHDNRHTMDPERYRGDVVEMQVRDDGLYGKIVFPSVEAAKAIIDNPNLGVSARIRVGVGRSDGSTVNRGIIHVLGTLDPQVSGMSAWETADLSNDQPDVLDLSTEEYDMGKKIEDYTDEEISALTDSELDALLGEIGFSAEEIAELAAEEDGGEEVVSEQRELVGAGAELSNQAGSRDVELANARADQAIAQARATAQRLADAEWREARASYLAAGVPPFAVDLAKPVLSRPDDMVVDLSNEGTDDLNTSAVVRGLLDAMKGMVDLSNEQGHGGTFSPSDTEDPDAALLAQWAQVD